MNKNVQEVSQERHVNEINSLLEKNNKLEKEVGLFEKELLELKEAYKEKTRKCSAWERVQTKEFKCIYNHKSFIFIQAYGTLRAQLVGTVQMENNGKKR